jgi:hypothetical protein
VAVVCVVRVYAVRVVQAVGTVQVGRVDGTVVRREVGQVVVVRRDVGGQVVRVTVRQVVVVRCEVGGQTVRGTVRQVVRTAVRHVVGGQGLM